MISLFPTYFDLLITLAHRPCAEFPPSREVRSVYVLHSSTGIPKRICQFMVKACCVAATNDVPVHMSARRAISPTLSPIQSFLTLLFKKIYSRTHQHLLQQGRQRKIVALHCMEGVLISCCSCRQFHPCMNSIQL